MYVRNGARTQCEMIASQDFLLPVTLMTLSSVKDHAETNLQ